MILKITNIEIIKKIFQLGNFFYGGYVAFMVAAAAIYEAFFLYVVSATINGNDFNIPFVNVFIQTENLITFIIFAFVIRAVINFYSNYILYNYSISYIGHLSNALGTNITQIPAKNYLSDDSTHTIYTETTQVVSNIIHPILLIARDIMFVGTIVIFVIYQYQQIAVPFFIYFISGSILIVLILNPFLKSLGIRRQTLDQTRLKRTQDISKLRHELFLTAKNKNFVNKQFEKINILFSKIVAKYMFIRSSNRTFLEIILFLSIVLTTLTAKSDPYLTEFFVVLAVAALRALPAITSIVSFANGLSYHIPALEKVGGLLINDKHLNDITDKFMENKNKISNLLIEFSGVDSSKKFSHTFRLGALNIIKGESGSGKSSLIKSLIGESELFSIKVKADSKDISQDILHGSIAYCPQDIHIVRGSLTDNALLLCDEKEDLENLAKEMMIKLDFGNSLMSRSEINPSSVSGGQKRKLALLRCLMLDREILICDEPTSELDDETSEIIRNLLISISKTKMVIITSHDEGLIKASKNILEINDEHL
jgi:ABC-type multidrug transport system fused ATPase/permease subunit